jgi:hypothetical protein
VWVHNLYLVVAARELVSLWWACGTFHARSCGLRPGVRLAIKKGLESGDVLMGKPGNIFSGEEEHSRKGSL